MSDNYQSKYDQRQGQNSFVDTAQNGSKQVFKPVQNNYIQDKQTLAEAAGEIQQLLEQLQQSNPTDTPIQKAAVAEAAIQEIEAHPTLKEKIIRAIQAMGMEAFIELIDHPVANILRAGMEELIDS